MGKRKGESTGLGYLRQVRPEAMEHLLKFFAESARNLDPKTRFLISIVTKVVNFSPRGLEQYVRRAMAEGASANEVIDAILCSYPCAGLTRVVDAIDVVLDLGIDAFDVDAVNGALRGALPPGDPSEASPQWCNVGRADEVPADGGLRVQKGVFDLALFRLDDAFVAIDNVCPHLKGGSLAAGHVDEGVVSCPFHGWRFDLNSGRCLSREGARVRTYDVREIGGELEVLLPSLPEPESEGVETGDRTK